VPDSDNLAMLTRTAARCLAANQQARSGI